MDILDNISTLKNRSVHECPPGYHWASINRLGLQGWTLHRDCDRQIVGGVERLDGGPWVPFILSPDGTRDDAPGYTGTGAAQKARAWVIVIVDAWRLGEVPKGVR